MYSSRRGERTSSVAAAWDRRGCGQGTGALSVNQRYKAIGNCCRSDAWFELQLAWPEAALPPCAGVMVVPLLRPACLAVSWYLAAAGRHCTPTRRDPRSPSHLTFVAVPHVKRNTSRRSPSALQFVHVVVKYLSSDPEISPKETVNTYRALSPRTCCSSRNTSTQMFRLTCFFWFPFCVLVLRRPWSGMKRQLTLATCFQRQRDLRAAASATYGNMINAQGPTIFPFQTLKATTKEMNARVLLEQLHVSPLSLTVDLHKFLLTMTMCSEIVTLRKRSLKTANCAMKPRLQSHCQPTIAVKTNAITKGGPSLWPDRFTDLLCDPSAEHDQLRDAYAHTHAHRRKHTDTHAFTHTHTHTTHTNGCAESNTHAR